MTQKLVVVYSDCLVSNTWSKTGSRVLIFKGFLYLKTENWRNQQGMKQNFADPQYATQGLVTEIACMLHVYITISLACVHSQGCNLE